MGFLIRIVLLFLGKYVIQLPHSDGDALVIENKAFIYANSQNLDYKSIFSQGHNFLAYVFSLVYTVFGRVETLLGIFMVSLGTILIKYIHDASILIWGDAKLARKAAWFAVIFPQFCLHSALLLREIPINICLVLALMALVKYSRSSKGFHLMKASVFVILATLLHSGMFVVFVGIILFYLFGRQNTMGIFRKVLSVGLIGGLIVYINGLGIGLGKFGGDLSDGVDILYQRELQRTQGGSAYPDWMRLTNSLSDLWIVPIRVIAFLFSPLVPFLVKSPSHMLGAIDSLFYVYISRLFYKNRRYLKLSVEYNLIISICITLAFVFSLGVTNAGTAIRHRSKFAPLILVVMFEKRHLRNLVKGN